MDTKSLRLRAASLRDRIESINRDGNISGKYTVADIQRLSVLQDRLQAELSRVQRLLRPR